MKKIVLSFLIVFVAASLFAQDTKNVVYDANAEIRKVAEFKAVDISGAVSLYLSQGTETAVAISVENGDRDKVKTEVKNGVLKIYVESNFWGRWGDNKIKAYVTVKEIDKIAASGASLVRITDKLTASDLKVVLSGASSLKGDIKADNLILSLSGASNTHTTLSSNSLKIGVSGASTATVSGTTNSLNIDAGGASSLRAFDLVANTCSADASGASTIRVNVTKEFSKIQASGASSIHYKGDATIKNFESSGASSIKKDSGK